MADFKAQNLTNMAWAFATANQLNALLFRGFSTVAERRVHEFDAQGLANSAWAFAAAGMFHAVLFR